MAKSLFRVLAILAVVTSVAGVAHAFTGEWCSTTNGTCAVNNFGQYSSGALEKYAWTVTGQTAAARVQLYDPASNLVGVYSLAAPPGGTGGSCNAWHSCGLWGVPIWCGQSGASVACESTGSGAANGAIACSYSNGGGDTGSTVIKCCTYNGGC